MFIAVVATIVVPALLLLPNIREPFRLPKLLVSEGFVLLSLAALGLSLLRSPGRISWSWLRHPAILFLSPLLVIATTSLVTSSHHEHVREALFSLWIGGVALIAWSLGLQKPKLALHWLLPPAIVLSLVAMLQFHGLVEQLSQLDGRAARLGVTSLAGAVGDLGSYLVLPCLLAQYLIWRSMKFRRNGEASSRWVLPTAVLTLVLGRLRAVSQSDPDRDRGSGRRPAGCSGAVYCHGAGPCWRLPPLFWRPCQVF